jgi:trigger factor
LRPEVKLGEYKEIRLTPHPVEVTDEEVNSVLERFQMNQATMVPVSRGVQNRDTVTLDISGGAPDHPPVDEKGVRVVVGDPKQPGLPFQDELLGMTASESKEIDHTYPEDYEEEGLRGKTAHYTVTVHDIKETQLPELDDEFAKAISQFQTLDQFKGNVREILRKQKEREEEDRFAEEVVDTVAEKSEVGFPPSMLDREVEHEVEHLQEDVRRLGLTWEKYIELSAKTEEQVREEIRPRAEKQLKRMLVLSEVMKQQDPQVTREEVNAEIDRRVRQTEEAGGNPNTARRSYNAREARENIEYNLRLGKTIAGLVASAKGESAHGRIVTPDMLRGQPNPIPSGLITDPSQVRPEDWPKGLQGH